MAGMFAPWVHDLSRLLTAILRRAAARDCGGSQNAGPAVVVWPYRRGSGLSKEGETALDVAVALCCADCCATSGAHHQGQIASAHLEQAAAKKVYEADRDSMGDADGARKAYRAEFV